jgi:hypothetical protein
MKRSLIQPILCVAFGLIATLAVAREDVRFPNPKGKTSFKTEAGDCVSPQSQFDLEINNVRARLLTGGDLWWNLSEARYEVPKGSGTGITLNAIFAGAIWISGFDAGGNLKVAAQRYRAGGDDYWPGPLNNAGLVDKATCNKYDRFFNVFGADIEKAQSAFLLKGSGTTLGDIPKGVQAWPGKGNPYLSTDPSLIGETFIINDNLAPFKDVDNDGIYDPVKGDYPYIPCRGDEGEAYADQMIFWVINDVGNQHTETNGQAIGVQVNCLAFAFQTTDDINNMTFYKYEIINKSPTPLFQTYISQWSDPDLGNFSNDAVGCDTTRSLGIVYNSTTPDADNGGVAGYGSQLPLIGIDFFEGPLSDSGQQLGLSSFVYFTNGASFAQSDPSTAAQYRNYMTGFWNDGTPFTEGGNGYNTGAPTDFLFPGNPIDPAAWSDYNSGQQPGDRRMVQTSGPFTLLPGIRQYVTIGVVFVRPAGGVSVPPNFLTTIAPADDKAQALFNTCFKLVDGPKAPTLSIRELDKQLIINFKYFPGDNNFGESYDQVDGAIAQTIQSKFGGNGDSTYTFEGYKLYQVSNPKVSATDLDDPTKALLVAQVDVKNNVSNIINIAKENSLGGLLVPVLKVEGANGGIKNSFVINEDLFATGTNKVLTNHKTYYYTAVAYAHNDYFPYNQVNPNPDAQLTPYLQGRSNFKIYSAIPHIIDSRNEGTVLNAAWGEGTVVKRIEGRGNGGNNLQLSAETIERILSGSNAYFSDTLVYVKGFDPIGFKVNDPVALKEADFELRFVDTITNEVGKTTKWVLRDLTNGVNIPSDRTLDRPYTQQIMDGENDYGFSISLGTPTPIGSLPAGYPNNTFAARDVYGHNGQSSIEFANPVEKWLTFLQDGESNSVTNWIRSGKIAQGGTQNVLGAVFDDNWWYSGNTPSTFPNFTFSDPDQNYENILGGTWAPYCLTANYSNRNSAADVPPYVYGPGFKWRNYANAASTSSQTPPQNTLDRLASVDIVITPDKSKWSRCIVFETGEDEGVNQGANIAPNARNARKGQIRMAVSKVFDNNGNLIDDPNFDINPLAADTGRSYFPGYAINVETGERLNICFGESSDQGDQNGRDMLWNPTDKVYAPISIPGQIVDRLPYFGGKHFVYVMDTKYDECAAAQRLLLDNYTNITGPPLFNINQALAPLYRTLMWTSIPMLTPGYQLVDGFIPPAELNIKLRVEKPFNRLLTNAYEGVDSLPRYQFSTKGMGLSEEQADVAESALDQIRVVPNPYLAYSAYETDQNSNRVKVTNLPNTCTITIFALDGTIIRRLNRAIGVDPVSNKKIEVTNGGDVNQINLDNSLEWDLKNDKGIVIGSGIYLFHVAAPGIGEKTLKWFGAVRPADTSNF